MKFQETFVADICCIYDSLCDSWFLIVILSNGVALERYCNKVMYVWLMFRQNMAWYDSQQSGQLQNRLIEDLEKVRLGVSDKVALSVQNLSTFVTGIILGEPNLRE